ncbi:MAG: hypothetical protein WBG86_20000, partial [Polyangiales bacterium]
SKQWFADGSITVRNLYDVRTFGDNAEQSVTNVWRTVLFVNFRNGANGMIALDVTNPCKPEFMWQFTDPDLGDTYGQPTAAEVFLQDKPGGPIIFGTRQAHAVIILPGGQGVEDAAASPCTIAAGPALPADIDQPDGSTVIVPRSQRRCWRGSNSVPPADPIGRALYFIDLSTGSLIRKIGGRLPEDDSIFPAPLNGAVSVFRGDIGTIGSAVYTVDADGILWRINISSSDPDDWEAEAMHDIYYDGAYDDAEPSYYPPALTVDARGRVVILTGTGNIDVLDDADAKNRVISLTEEVTFDANGDVDTLEGRLNWEVILEDGEQMTGPVELFSGQAFFGTFEATGPNPIDACGVAGSRIFGVSFLDNPLIPGDLVPALEDSLMNPATFVDGSDIPDLANSLVIGVQVSQQPVCTTTTQLNLTDPFGNAFTLAMPTDTSGRNFKLVATLSGSGTPAAGLAIDVLDQDITAPQNFTTISGMGAAE